MTAGAPAPHAASEPQHAPRQATDVGQTYYQHCVDLLKRFEQADGVVEAMQAAPRGLLRVNTSIPIGDLITPVIADYTAQFPEVSVRMISTGRDVDLIEEQFDVSIRPAMPENESLIVRKLAEYHYVVCVAPKYFLKRAQPQTPDDLAAENCILYTDSKFGDRWSIFQSHEAITARGNLQTNSPLVLLKAAENGQGIVVLSNFTAAPALAEGRLVQILQDYPPVRYPVVAIHPHRGLVPTKTVVFIDMVAGYLRDVISAAVWANGASGDNRPQQVPAIRAIIAPVANDQEARQDRAASLLSNNQRELKSSASSSLTRSA